MKTVTKPKANLENECVTLRVPGDLVSTNVETVRGEINRLLEGAEGTAAKWTTFRLELTAAKMVDSMGLNLIVGLLKTLEKRGAKMQITYSSQNVLRAFTFTRLNDHIELIKV